MIFLFAWPAETFLPILLIVGLSFTVWGLALPVGEALALTGMRRFGLDYGRMRVGGSVAFIVTNLGAGALLTLLHAEAIFWLVFAALAISALVAFGLPVTPPAIRALDDTVRPPRPALWPVLREPGVPDADPGRRADPVEPRHALQLRQPVLARPRLRRRRDRRLLGDRASPARSCCSIGRGR